jgi:pre-rRNA-processing protein TSR1
LLSSNSSTCIATRRRPSIASVYGPVMYPPAPVLAFKESVSAAGMGAELVMSGSVRKADPDRVILKRIILTGVPFKVHKSKAVVGPLYTL